jgi:glycosyltransferase involved in cell wall biosynthesis
LNRARKSKINFLSSEGLPAMRILIAALSATIDMTGVSRHAANVVRCLLTRSDVSAVHLLVAPWQHDTFRNAISRDDSRLHIHPVSLGPGTLKRYLWYYTSLPAVAEQLEADVVHMTYPTLLRGGAFHCPTVVSLHDLYPYDLPENFDFGKVLFNRLVWMQCLRTVDAIACVSNSTRKQLGLWASQAILNRSTTINNCVEALPPASTRSPLPNWSGSPFFLCVASQHHNKNILLMLKVFNSLLSKGDINPSTLLVVVGVTGPETPQIHSFIRAAGLAERVVFLQGITDEEMQWCYRNCEMLLAQSMIEGFGFPIAEGLLTGCRIVCSDIPAYRELGGSNCRYFSLGPAAEDAFAEAIRAEIGSCRNPPVSLPQCSAPVIAGQYMELYRKTISLHASRL